MDLTGVGALAGGLGTFVGAAGGVLTAGRRSVKAHRRCQDRVADLELTVGIILALLPGGRLAERFDLYRRDRDTEVTTMLDQLRHRHEERTGRSSLLD